MATELVPTPIKVFIFSGQSNMTGEFGMDKLNFMGYDLSLPQTDIQSDYWLSGATRPGGWGPLEPHDEITNTSYGSELSFMRTIKDADPSTEYAALKLSRGGANLADRWAPHNNDIYPQARDYGLAAIQRLIDDGYAPEIVGLIWIHGDGDLFVTSHSDTYDVNLKELVDQFRIDFAAPDMMALVSQLHIDQRNGNSLVPLQRQRKIDYVAAEPNSALIDVDDLVFRDFFVHYDGTSRLILGQRLANVYLATQPPPCIVDFNNDGFVDNGDINAFVAVFLTGDLSADLNSDGFIDNGDVIAFISLYLAGCP